MVPLYNHDGYVGCVSIGVNGDGEPEVTGFIEAPESPYEKLRSMLRCIFHKDELYEIDWAEGFGVRPRGFTKTYMVAYYTGAPGKYSLYQCVPDQRPGFDIAEEKELVIGSLAQIEAALRRAPGVPSKKHRP